MGDYRRHHYVPQWYQHRFISASKKERKFHYLDLRPDVLTAPNGTRYSRRALLPWGPPQCFYQDDLYTTRFPSWESTEIEQRFFGKIDSIGSEAVDYLANFRHPSADPRAINDFLLYLSVQKLRTPKGLNYLKRLTNAKSKNSLLFRMQELQQLHCALWTESVWSIVDASESNTKFIISDDPVTLYNSAIYPESNWCRTQVDPYIWFNGTHTIFPLSLNRALILTNLSWARNPFGKPEASRPHPKLFRTAMFNALSIQEGRKLTEEEVLAVNYIIKRRAHRYIAADEREWLYPERRLKTLQWSKLSGRHLLMPDPRSMTFTSEILVGYESGGADAFDEYGRRPGHIDFRESNRQGYEWNTFNAFVAEYARIYGARRRGLAFEFGERDRAEDGAEYHDTLLRSESFYKKKMRDWPSSKRPR